MSYETNVFINCPFDPEYRPHFEAVVFTTYDCGFDPRCSLESEDSSQVRIEKITSIIRQSRLGIHDISRTELDSANGLPRFNMPFEFGIFVGAKAFGAAAQRTKAALVLDVDRYRYQKFISDIAGQDLRAHSGDPEVLIQQVRDFLAAQSAPGLRLPGGALIVKRYWNFRRDLAESCRRVHIDPEQLTFRDLTVSITEWLKTNPLALAA